MLVEHVGPDCEDVTQEARPGPPGNAREPVVVPEHVAELYQQATFLRFGDNTLEVGIVVPRGLVVEGMLASVDDLLGLGQALSIQPFGGHGDDGRIVEQFGPVEPPDGRPGRRLPALQLLAPRGVRFMHAGDLHVRVLQHDLEDPLRVAVLGPVLGHPDGLDAVAYGSTPWPVMC